MTETAVEKRIAELAEALYPQAIIDAACDAPQGTSDDEIIVMARENAMQRARATVANEIEQSTESEGANPKG
jgi:hypothetical protein